MCVRSANPCLKSLNITSRRKAHFSPNRGRRFQANLHTPCTVTVPLVSFCMLLQQLSQHPWTHSASFLCSDLSPLSMSGRCILESQSRTSNSHSQRHAPCAFWQKSYHWTWHLYIAHALTWHSDSHEAKDRAQFCFLIPFLEDTVWNVKPWLSFYSDWSGMLFFSTSFPSIIY